MLASRSHDVCIARQIMFTWKALLDKGHIDALRAMPARSRPAHLGNLQLHALKRTLRNARRNMASALSCGHASTCAFSSNTFTASHSARCRSDASLAVLGFRCKSPNAVPSSVNRMPCRLGSTRIDRRSKKCRTRRTADRLHRRVQPERVVHADAHMGDQGANVGHPVSLQLDVNLRDRWVDPHEGTVPSA